MSDIAPLTPEQLCRRCDPRSLGFATTAEVTETVDIVDQSRAIDAVGFGIAIKRPGFNLFVLGEPGSGRHSAVRRLLEARAATEPIPGDLCYVNNFAEPNRPRLLQLPAGRGARLRADMQQFVSELAKAITAAFESDEYRARIESIQEEFKEKEEGALRELGQASSEVGIALLRTPHGFVFAPIKGEETMSSEEFQALPDAEKERYGKVMEEHGEKLQKLMHQFPRWRREMQARLKDVSRDTMRFAVGHLVEELKENYADLANVGEFLDQVLEDVVDSAEELRETPKSEGEMGGGMSGLVIGGSLPLARYQVNLLVDHASTTAAPVVTEDNPIYPNLVGRVDHIAHMGTLVTNFTMIMAGALHRANGGYLVLDADKLLTQPYAWEGLKRALKSAQVRIESLGQVYGLMSTLSLEPEPMPLIVKVVLIGERMVYYLLKEYDPEFDELFKVEADFEDEVVRDDTNTSRYARFIATLARADALRPLAAGAVARVIEHAARLADDAERLSAATRRIRDLMVEADHLAGEAGRATVEAADIKSALAARQHRADRLREAGFEQIRRGVRLIDVAGSHGGQVNGLAVFDLGEYRFGHPVRITATARIGEGDVVDIERESEMGGEIHTKGVLILTSFLAARYARSLPLSLSASLVFEQSYGPVEGDSASLAELCALLSALSGVPIKQSLAVTGSINQFGRVQAIGGVNEKIEGFFDICAARGLSGEQGVVIPAANVMHLMLREDIVAACAEGRFRVWAVADVDQAIELLTGVPAGEPNDKGEVPEGTMNYLVATQLADLSALRQAYGAAAHGKRSKRKRDE
ncbi:MAG: ATP-binding protein [Rhodocyclaceae bacterium]|nr:ATP-binding protein [Rhodocyclaceae bacterium]